MGPLVFLPFLLLIPIGLVVAWLYFLGVFKTPVYPPFSAYAKQDYVLTPAELAFFNALVQCIPNGCYLLAKVRIGDIVRVHGLVEESPEWWKKFGPIAKKHVDFLLVTRRTFAPRVVIELDDRSHIRQDRKERDSLVDQVMAAAHLPILHIPYSRSGYSRTSLARRLAEALSEAPAAPLVRATPAKPPASLPDLQAKPLVFHRAS